MEIKRNKLKYVTSKNVEQKVDIGPITDWRDTTKYRKLSNFPAQSISMAIVEMKSYRVVHDQPTSLFRSTQWTISLAKNLIQSEVHQTDWDFSFNLCSVGLCAVDGFSHCILFKQNNILFFPFYSLCLSFICFHKFILLK